MKDDDLLGPSTEESTESPLRQLMMLACPPHPKTGHKSIRRLASLMTSEAKPDGLVDEALFKWIRQNRIPPIQAARIVDLSEGRVTLGDFSPYYLLDNLDA